MRQKKVAAIFPAFGCKYLGNEIEIMAEFSDDLYDLLDRAVKSVKIDKTEFESCRDGNFNDELQSQYAAYIYSCALSNIIKRIEINTDYAAGYSMGLYAALYHAESASFEQGLDLIRTAYQHIVKAAENLKFGVGLVSGLERNDVTDLVSESNELEIININNKFSFLIAGYGVNVKRVLSLAREMGAMNAKYLPFNSPYHSRFMIGAAMEFRDYLESMDLCDPVCPIISTIDQRVITSRGGIVKDLAHNICRNINWLDTMTYMIDAGVNTFIECGPGKSLKKIARFIDGSFEVYTAHTLKNLIPSARMLSRVQTVTSMS